MKRYNHAKTDKYVTQDFSMLTAFVCLTCCTHPSGEKDSRGDYQQFVTPAVRFNRDDLFRKQ